MAFNLSSSANPISVFSSSTQRSQLLLTKCESSSVEVEAIKLEIGSPIIVTHAPHMIKTAASVPCLRRNAGLVKPGDVGRIVSRKPKDVVGSSP